MVRGGFSYINERENDYRHRINNKMLHDICGTKDLSNFINTHQLNYSKHVIRMSQDRTVKMLMFNDDKYTKRGRPCKTLIDQVVERNSTTVDEVCNRALMRK